MRLGSETFMPLAIAISPLVVGMACGSVPLALGVMCVNAFLLFRFGPVKKLREMQLGKKIPRYKLTTIPPSHFAEKVRWSMDRLDIDYEEEMDMGMLGVFLTARPIPALEVRKAGMSPFQLYNSSDILRYLWATCQGTTDEDKAKFLKPTPELLEFERRWDQMGHALQSFVYNTATDRKQFVTIWGMRHPEIPVWQQLLLSVGYPAFIRIVRTIFPRSSLESKISCIEENLEDAENRLSRHSFVLGEELTLADIHLAANCSIFLNNEQFAAGKSEPSYNNFRKILPDGMVEKRKLWTAKYPNVIAHANRMYKEYRI